MCLLTPDWERVIWVVTVNYYGYGYGYGYYSVHCFDIVYAYLWAWLAFTRDSGPRRATDRVVCIVIKLI